MATKGFLDLPPEIRVMIYSLLSVPPPHLRDVAIDRLLVCTAGLIMMEGTPPGLMLASKLIYSEFEPIWTKAYTVGFKMRSKVGNFTILT